MINKKADEVSFEKFEGDIMTIMNLFDGRPLFDIACTITATLDMICLEVGYDTGTLLDDMKELFGEVEEDLGRKEKSECLGS